MNSNQPDLAGFFGEHQLARRLFEQVLDGLEGLGPYSLRVSKSQVAFLRVHAFAAVWLPAQYLKREAAPLVLTVYLRRRDPSLRWKQVVEPAAGRFTHHLELFTGAELDDEARAWLREAWEGAA